MPDLDQRMMAQGRHIDALQAALVATSIEPYRETAHRAVIAAYLAQGNRASAVLHYERYKRVLSRDLGLRPTREIQTLVQGAGVD